MTETYFHKWLKSATLPQIERAQERLTRDAKKTPVFYNIPKRLAQACLEEISRRKENP